MLLLPNPSHATSQAKTYRISVGDNLPRMDHCPQPVTSTGKSSTINTLVQVMYPPVGMPEIQVNSRKSVRPTATAQSNSIFRLNV
jgi:predicted GTPase